MKKAMFFACDECIHVQTQMFMIRTSSRSFKSEPEEFTIEQCFKSTNMGICIVVYEVIVKSIVLFFYSSNYNFRLVMLT